MSDDLNWLLIWNCTQGGDMKLLAIYAGFHLYQQAPGPFRNSYKGVQCAQLYFTFQPLNGFGPTCVILKFCMVHL